MINHQAILALVAWSLLGGTALLLAGGWALRILRRWDPARSSPGQLLLERGTTLVSALVALTLAFQALSFFLFILAAEDLHGRFVGAMCAAGTLHVNAYGYPALGLKLLNAGLGVLWLLVNHLDAKGYDFPLLRVKYRFLLLLAPLLVAGEALQGLFFAQLRPDVITSCCGSLFGLERRTLASELVSLPIPLALGLWAIAGALALGAGAGFLRGRRARGPFSVGALLWAVAGGLLLVSALSIYLYELPTHHCPFCMLKSEYHGIGYAFYGLLFIQGSSALSLLALGQIPARPSLADAQPRMERWLAGLTLGSGLAFGLLGLAVVAASSLRLT